MKKKTLILFLGALFCLTSCKEKRDSKFYQFTLNFEGEDNVIFIPLEYEGEKFIIYHYPVGFYLKLNIKFIDSNSFFEALYRKEKAREHISINKNTYEEIKHLRVNEISEIKELYDKGGIDAVLREKDCLQLFDTNHEEYKYVAYLCWLNNIFISSDDESGEEIIYRAE